MHALKAQLTNFLRQRGISPAKAVVFVLVAVVVLYLLLTSLQDSSPKPVVKTAAPTVVATPVVPKIFIHMVGQVQHPGVFQLDLNARVFDAVSAAGGFTADADQASVNLARVLSDGEQILVTKVGEGGGAAGLGSGAASLINLNRANATELDALPGIGPAIAGRIVDWRNANGGFHKKEDLMQVKGIGKAVFANIKDLVTF
ncbi:MAG: hypothetical protein RL670_685 [Actinomycetota bacterium]